MKYDAHVGNMNSWHGNQLDVQATYCHVTMFGLISGENMKYTSILKSFLWSVSLLKLIRQIEIPCTALYMHSEYFSRPGI